MPTLAAVGLGVAVLFAVVVAYTLHRDTNRETTVEVDSAHDTEPESVEHAHEIMQSHRDCDLDWCAAKWQSYWLLADAHHLTPTEQMLRKRATA